MVRASIDYHVEVDRFRDAGTTLFVPIRCAQREVSSYSKHLLETGVDITVVQTLLGHASLRATEIYTHISTEHIGRTRSPLDLLGTSEAAVLG